MNLPQIEINGTTYTMTKPKARGWTAMAKFEQDRAKILVIDYVDKVCEFLATLFDGVTADDLLDNVPLEDIQTLYFDCYNAYWDMLAGKFEELEKNSQSAAVSNS